MNRRVLIVGAQVRSILSESTSAVSEKYAKELAAELGVPEKYVDIFDSQLDAYFAGQRAPKFDSMIKEKAAKELAVEIGIPEKWVDIQDAFLDAYNEGKFGKNRDKRHETVEEGSSYKPPSPKSAGYKPPEPGESDQARKDRETAKKYKKSGIEKWRTTDSGHTIGIRGKKIVAGNPNVIRSESLSDKKDKPLSGPFGKGRKLALRAATKAGYSQKEAEEVVSTWESGWGVLNVDIDSAKGKKLLDDFNGIFKKYGLSESYISEAKGDDAIIYYVTDGIESFLKESAKLIKKSAGGHAENVEVSRSRSTVWLEYKGQDRSDMQLEFKAWIYLETDSATVHYEAKSGFRGNDESMTTYRMGELKPSDILDKFLTYF